MQAINNARTKSLETRRKNASIETNEEETFHNVMNIQKDLHIYSDFCKNVWHLININGNRADSFIALESNKLKFKKDGIRSSTATEKSTNIKYLGVFDPRSIWKIRWDFFMGIWILYSILIIPYRFGWLDDVSKSGQAFDYLVDALFFADVVVNFNTAYYDSRAEIFVFDRRRIAVTYCTFWFWVDIISAIPLELFLIVIDSFNANFIRFIKLLRLIRLIRVIKLYRNSSWEIYLEKLRISPALLNLLLLAIQILFLCHIFACFWHYLSLNEVTSWVTVFEFTDSSSVDTYVASLYFVVVTMLTVGYGDIHATTNAERIFATITMLTAGLIFGALLSKVSLLLEKFDPQAQAYKEQMSAFKSYLDGIQISVELKNEAKEAYAYYLHERSAFDERNIFDELPQPMVVKLVDQIYLNNLCSIRVFNTYEKPFVVEFIKHMRPFQARKGNELFKEGDVLNDVIFISSGSITIAKFNGTVNIPLGSCDDGSYFGDFEYLKNTTSIASYRAAANCNLVSVSHSVIANATEKYLDAGNLFRLELTERYDNFMRVVESIMGQKILANSDKTPPQKMYFVDGSIEIMPTDCDDSEEKFKFSYHEKDQSNIYRIAMRDSFGGLTVVEKDRDFLFKKWIIHPKDKKKIYWDLTVAILVFISLLVSPVDVAFDTNSLGNGGDLFVSVFFMADIVLSFRTAYESKIESAYVIDSALIAKHYFRTMFFVDFISSFPINYVTNSIHIPNSIVKLLRVSRLMRLAKVLKLRMYLNYLESVSGISPNAIDMFLLIVKVIIIGHLIACIWWGFSTLLSSPGSRWYENHSIVGDFDLINAPVSTQYLWSFYWAAATLTTVGYGDISATNTGERILNILILLVGASVFGFIVANVSSIIDHVDRKRSVITDKVTEISEYLKSKNCPVELADSIINHFRQVYSLQLAHHGKDFLSALPIHIKNRILLVQYNSKIRYIPIFRYIPNKSVCIYLFELMNPIFYQPGQLIIREGDRGNEILFVVSGKAVALKKSKTSSKQTRKSPLVHPSSLFSKKPVDSREEPDIGNSADHQKLVNQHAAEHRYRAKLGSQYAQQPNNIGNFIRTSIKASKTNVATFLRDALLDDRFPQQPEKLDLFSDIKTWIDNDEQVQKRGFSTVGNLMPGHFIGHAALLKQCNHKISVVATESVCAYEMQKKALSELIRIEPTVAMQFQSALASAVMQQNRKFDHGGKTHFLRNLRRKSVTNFGKKIGLSRKYSSIRSKPSPSKARTLKIIVDISSHEEKALKSPDRKQPQIISKRANIDRVFSYDKEIDQDLDRAVIPSFTRKESKKSLERMDQKGFMTDKLRSVIHKSLWVLASTQSEKVDRGKMSILLHRRWSFSDTFAVSRESAVDEGDDDYGGDNERERDASQALFVKRRSVVPSASRNSTHSLNSWDEKSSDEMYSLKSDVASRKRLRRPTFPFIDNKILYKFDTLDSSIL